MNASIDALIREHKIKPEEGSSLINDSSYMYEIKNHLVAMAETVFIVQQQNTTESERELTLDDNELVKVMQTEND
jgi:phosphate:Na+ symporter